MMKNTFLKVLAIGSCISFMAIHSFAIPARKGVFKVTNADGTSVSVTLSGDEFSHQYYTEDGYPLIEKDGSYYYCSIDEAGDLSATDIIATEVAQRPAKAVAFLSEIDKDAVKRNMSVRIEKLRKSSKKYTSSRYGKSSPKNINRSASALAGPPYEKGYGLFPSATFPAYGTQKGLVILVEYPDAKFNTSNKEYEASDYFNRMLNQRGFSDFGATGSALDYFIENSVGAFVPEFDVYGPVRLPKSRASYGANDSYGDDRDPGGMVKDACDLLDDIIDFREYDRDNDGVVDNIYIFYAGLGEASGGGSNTIWPHAWTMSEAGYPDLYYDGVLVNDYACSNEWVDAHPAGVGNFIHEFSHVLGLPDLYAYNKRSYTPEEWSVLDYGPYNNEGMTPPNYGAYERYALGWMKPYVIDDAASVTLPDITHNSAGLVKTDRDTEFFLFENRQQTGWDKYLPGHGMLIWHIDYNMFLWEWNQVNETHYHQCVDLIEANDIESSGKADGHSFPGTSHVTAFTSTTSPAFKAWEGNDPDLPITHIKEADGIITFDVKGGGPSYVLSSVDGLEIDDAYDGEERYFTVGGLEVKYPREGLYIVKKGNKTRKVIIK